jgi:hypothetical protein
LNERVAGENPASAPSDSANGRKAMATELIGPSRGFSQQLGKYFCQSRGIHGGNLMDNRCGRELFAISRNGSQIAGDDLACSETVAD